MNEPLIIDPEFENLIPPLTPDEFDQLEQNIISDGEVITALIVWNGVIIDGHNRYKIVQKHPEIPYTTRNMDFDNRYEAISWICNNQLGRRNLTPRNKRYLLGQRYDAELKVASFHGNQYTLASESGLDKFCPDQIKHGTRSKITIEAGVSEGTVENASQYAKGVDAAEHEVLGMKHKILSGELKVPASEVAAIAQAPPEMRKELAENLTLPKAERKAKRDMLRNIAAVSARIDSDKPPVSADSFLDSLEATAKTMMESTQTLFEQCPELLTNAVYFDKVVSIMQEVKQFIIKIESEKSE